MKTTLIILATLLAATVASAHIPVTESATILDANGDGSNFAGNYRVVDDCNGNAFQKKQSKGLAIVKLNTSYENKTAGVLTKHAEFSYTYYRRQSGSNKFEIKNGKFTLNNLKKITELKKVDNEVVETKVTYTATNVDVAGDLADDSGDGSYAVSFLKGGIQINGKECDQRVELTPTTDTTP
jgi:hypothetical protein